MAVIEPTLERFSNPFSKYFQATRPPFLVASAVPCLLGMATAHFSGISLDIWAGILTLLGAMLAQAGINVLNDYYDARNGTDAANTQRLYPFTGGSRFIQNRVLSEAQTAAFGWGLMVLTAIIGLALVPLGGSGLIVIGLLGLLIGWSYSAPPLALNSHGLGEVSVGVGFGGLMTLGADMVQRGGYDALPLFAAVPYALLVTALLYINQFPDMKADAAAGKHHLVVRLGPRRARWGYLLLVVIAYGYLLAMIAAGILPGWAGLGLLPLPLSLSAARHLLVHAETPSRLLPAIPRTIAAMTGHGLLLTLGLWLAA